MAFLSIHTMEGDPDDLLARKRQHMDPVTERRIARVRRAGVGDQPDEDRDRHGQRVGNPGGAAAFSQEPEVVRAHQASGLPRAATFERFTEADCVFYGKG